MHTNISQYISMASTSLPLITLGRISSMYTSAKRNEEKLEKMTAQYRRLGDSYIMLLRAIDALGEFSNKAKDLERGDSADEAMIATLHAAREKEAELIKATLISLDKEYRRYEISEKKPRKDPEVIP